MLLMLSSPHNVARRQSSSHIETAECHLVVECLTGCVGARACGRGRRIMQELEVVRPHFESKRGATDIAIIGCMNSRLTTREYDQRHRSRDLTET